MTLELDGAIEGSARFTVSANLESMLRAAVAGADSADDLPDRLLAMTPEGGFGRVHHQQSARPVAAVLAGGDLAQPARGGVP